MGQPSNDDIIAAQFVVSRHAVDGMDERVTALAREIGDARRLLTDTVKKAQTLAEAIDNAVRFLENGKASWKAQRAEVLPALHAAQQLARQVSGEQPQEDVI